MSPSLGSAKILNNKYLVEKESLMLLKF